MRSISPPSSHVVGGSKMRRKKEQDELKQKGPVGIHIGPGVEAQLDAWSNTPTGIELGGDVTLGGSFAHEPAPGGNATYIHSMRTGIGSTRRATPTTPNPDNRVARRNSSATFTHIPGNLCACGFAAFSWQAICPRCARLLK